MIWKCQSGGASPETKRSAALDLRLAVDKEDAHTVVKLLLLGAGEAGKSTLRTQFRLLYSGKAVPDAERRALVPVMQAAALDGMRVLLGWLEAAEAAGVAAGEAGEGVAPPFPSRGRRALYQPESAAALARLRAFRFGLMEMTRHRSRRNAALARDPAAAWGREGVVAM